MNVLRATLFLLTALSAWPSPAAEPLRLAVFEADVTPPIGSPVAYAPTRSIVDPLSARGIVLTGSGKPIVLCAIDFIGIGGGGHDVWRETLAIAAGTSSDRVAVHSLHQHDAPGCDFSVTKLLRENGITGSRYDDTFTRIALDRTAQAVKKSVESGGLPVTHVGLGAGEVEKVASNRRLLGPDGKVTQMRFSSCRIPEAIAAPEGTIDPLLRSLSFWNGDEPVAVMTYYACHPQSYYGKGDVSCDFVGLARNDRQETTGWPHIHFNGAGGNVAAGKYNDGSPEMRPVLAQRLATGMKRAWEATKKVPLDAGDVSWKVERVLLPPGEYLDAESLQATISDDNANIRDRVSAARKLVFLRRCQAERPTEISCLSLGDARILHLPGELFVEYQLAAQEMAPQQQVYVAAYGDYAAGYIGTAVAYGEGGYETSQRASNVAPEVEAVLLGAIERLLADKE